MTSVKIHQQLILQKGAAKGKKEKREKAEISKQEQGRAVSHYCCSVCVPITFLSFDRWAPLFPSQGTAHSSPSRIQTLPLHCATWAERCPPRPPSRVPDPSLLKHLTGHTSTMFAHDIHFSHLLV